MRFKKRYLSGSDGAEETPSEVEPAAEAVSTPSAPSEVEQMLKDQVAKLESSNKSMEELLIDPAYTEFLASKEAAQTVETGVKFDEMTNSELVEHITKNITQKLGDRIDQGLSKVETNMSLKTAQEELNKLRAKHEDFDLYKTEMIAIAKGNPNLSIKRLYAIAKGEAGPRKPAVSSGQLPNNADPGKPASKTKGFNEHFDKAWNTSGLSKVLKEV